ncbi:hypothetical protein [Nostoc sp.]|uniref:hypothetical protein n=1 Tax=Nostoc sp. TaxID=1180 RepID=UPI002FFBCBD3
MILTCLFLSPADLTPRYLRKLSHTPSIPAFVVAIAPVQPLDTNSNVIADFLANWNEDFKLPSLAEF